MRLTELEPKFLTIKDGDTKTYGVQDEIAGADGVMFVCPLCFQNQGRPGSHSVICWAPQVPQTFFPVPGRWELLGTGYEDLTLRAGSSSVHLTGPGCGAHFFIENGAIRFP